MIHDIVCKMDATKKKNNTYNSSKSEDEMYKLLVTKFDSNDVIRQYKSKEYPFNCDFYIKSLDLYIELNGLWTHQDHFFDENNMNDLNKLNSWKLKIKTNPMYASAIDTWTIRDVKKHNTAIKNNLNYLVFWNSDLSDFKEWFETV